jgi:hypothetical protein
MRFVEKRVGRVDEGAAGNLVVLVLGGAAIAGVLVGALLGLNGGIDLVAEPARVAGAATTSYYDCPGGPAAGTVTRGDRVYVTARDDSGSWLQIRSPGGVERRAWMRAAHVLPDDSVGGLPVASCQVPVAVVVDTTIPATTTTVEATTSTTSTTSTTTTTTTTTLAPPSVGTVTSSENPIWESYEGEENCNTNPASPSLTVIAAPITAPSGIQSVTLLWSVGGESGSIPMALSSGQYRATLGPFDAEDPNVVPLDGSLPVTLTVRVTDSDGRIATRQIQITLQDCTFG